MSQRIGATPLDNGRTTFRVWAPRCSQLELVSDNGIVAMRPADGGYYETTLDDMRAGQDYSYRIDGERQRPDPASRLQPKGVHGPSRIVDTGSLRFQHPSPNIDLKQLCVYELHIGTFSEAGTFAGAIEHLRYLKELGINAVEVMPIAQFPGSRNWGYDGVQLFAAHADYGGPEGFAAFVDACHALGLAVILDVVYNHVGPEGNYLEEYGPYFTDRYRTPWGPALNFDGAESDPVRRFFIENALYWLRDLKVDGLRLDAVHAIYDFGAWHILAEMVSECQRAAQEEGRQFLLIGESDLNDVRVIRPQECGGWGLDAQWSDDFHHAVYTRLTGQQRGYLSEFGRVSQIAKSIKKTFVFDGIYSPHRQRRHGNDASNEPGERFVVCVQNHDQVANGSAGQRLASLVEPSQYKLAALTLMCGPNVPMLFQGEEYGERAPFHYFTNHQDADLTRAVVEGRRAEYAGLLGDDFASPDDPSTFKASKLRWECLEQAPYGEVLEWYRTLIALRKKTSCLNNGDKQSLMVSADDDSGALCLVRSASDGSAMLLAANFGEQAAFVRSTHCLPGSYQLEAWTGTTDAAAPPPEQELHLETTLDLKLPPWSGALYLRR